VTQLAAPESEVPESDPDSSVRVGLIATPTLDDAAAARLAEELGRELGRRYPNVSWELAYVRDPLVEVPVHLTEMVDAARARMLDEDWDLALYVTDVPVRLAHRPLLTHSSPTHGVALVSLPALGAVRVGRRLRDAAADALGALIGDAPRAKRRLVELADEVEDASQPSVAFLARVIEGNIRLLFGMIRANRPWRLAARLSRALVGALAAATFALISDDVWRIADSLDAPRLAALTVAATMTAVATLIAAHDLWERTEDPRVREQVMLFNIVTVATLAIGMLSLYAAVFVASLATAELLVDSSLFSRAVEHSVGFSEYLSLAWLTASLATVGGALGAGLESDVAVREAAYAYRPEDELTRPA
jgi:uncharacterized membrane protein